MPILGLRSRGLPHEIGRHAVLSAIDGVRESEWAAKCAIVVVAHPCARSDDEHKRDGGAANEDRRRGAIFPKKAQ